MKQFKDAFSDGDAYESNEAEGIWTANTSKQAAGEAVAEVCAGWSLHWIGTEPLAKICARHPELRIGSLLYTTPPHHPADETNGNKHS